MSKTTTMALTGFLLARISEDEEALQLVRERIYVDDDGCISEPIEVWADGEDRLPNHHNTWSLIYDPTRVLAECAAKRAIVADYEQAGMFLRMSSADSVANMTKDLTLFRVVKILAAVYIDHPDYLPEWKP